MNMFENKLFIPRNTEAEPNERELKIIREFDTRLGKFKEFIGVSSPGSEMKGYNLNNLNDSMVDRSDLDLIIIVDVSGPEHDVIDGIKKLHAEAKEIAEKYKEDKNGIYVSLEIFPIDLANLKKKFTDSLKRSATTETIMTICRLVTGHRIDHYRKEVRTMFSELNESQQKEVIKRVVKLIEALDVKSSISKLLQRKPELRDRREEIINARTAMWKKRVENILYGSKEKN